MSLYIQKLLPIAIYPLGVALILCIAAFALSFGDRIRALRAALLLAIIILWLASTPAVAQLLTIPLNKSNASMPIEMISPRDVAVVLGGGLAQKRDGDDHMGPAGDRIVQAALLWQAKKVHMIIVSGGRLPWAHSLEADAKIAGELLESFGVPHESILIDSNSRDTHENAVNTAAIWREKGFRSGLLVTSAFHMPRALATFRAIGLDVTPWPADPGQKNLAIDTVFDFVPDASALEATTTAVKEWIGLAAYRMLGWA